MYILGWVDVGGVWSITLEENANSENRRWLYITSSIIPKSTIIHLFNYINTIF